MGSEHVSYYRAKSLALRGQSIFFFKKLKYYKKGEKISKNFPVKTYI